MQIIHTKDRHPFFETYSKSITFALGRCQTTRIFHYTGGGGEIPYPHQYKTILVNNFNYLFQINKSTNPTLPR